MRDNLHTAANPREPAGNHVDFSITYLVAALSSIAGLLALFGLGLAALGHIGNLPPPQLTNNLCLDVKLEYLRSHNFASPTVMAVGSSVAWRSFDGDAVTRATNGRAVTFNAAFCGMKMNQTTFTAAYFLAHNPSIRDVLTIIAPQDMTECSDARTRVFDPRDVDDYVYRRRWPFPLYLEYFDPLTMAKNIAILRTMQAGKLPLDSLVFDRYGSAPLDTTLSAHDLVYGALPPFDPTCLAALRQLAEDTAAEQRRLVVVTMPINPEWKDRYDPDGRIVRDLATAIRSTLAGTPTTFWDADAAMAMTPSAFIDAIHIRWSAAKTFSRALVQATELGKPT